MKQTRDHFAGIQYGYAVWAGSAPHIGRTYKQSEAVYPIRAHDFAKAFDTFDMVDVWTMDGWLVTSVAIVGNLARMQVRKGKQVAHFVAPYDTLLMHNRPDLPHEECPWLKTWREAE